MMPNRQIGAGLAALAILASIARGETPPAATPALREALEGGRAVRVVCFGDSVTGVYYHTGARRAYTDMLGIALRQDHPRADVTTINAGISGNTTRDALARFDRDVLRHKPTLVTVMFGLNDVARIPIEEYRKNLDQIVARCRAAGAEVLLCTPNNVISTEARPDQTLRQYCDVVREAGRRLNVPVCDVYAEREARRGRDPLAWRLEMSDEIHPNMDGHKRIAESLARALTGKTITLADVPPPSPALPRTAARLKQGQPIRVLAMPPFDSQIIDTIKPESQDAQIKVTSWPTNGKSLKELEQDARARVRTSAPDLVVLAVPRTATADSSESFIHDYAWIMNLSLSFGAGGWDCVVVHPSVFAPGPAAENDDLIRRLVHAQDLTLIDRPSGDDRSAAEILRAWFHGQLSQK